jgi:phosphonate transport system substrate-binding protein
MGHKYKILFFCIFISLQSWAADPINEPLRIGTYTYGDNSRVENLRPLAELLEAKFKKQVEVISYPDINALLAAIRQGKVDISFISTMGNLLLHEGTEPHPMKVGLTLAVPENAANAYRTAFVVPRKSKIKSLKDVRRLQGIRLALVNPESTSGHLIPRSVLAERGIRSPESYFGTVLYAGSHRAALDYVSDGRADLAAFGSSAYTEYIENTGKNSKIRLIHMSAPIPLGPVLFHTSLEKDFQDALTQLMIALHLEHPEIFLKITEGWIEAKGAEKFIGIAPDYYDTHLRFRSRRGKY